MRELFKRTARELRTIFRSMIGIPDYQVYVDHLRTQHPERPVPTYEEFFRICQARRYDASRPGKCC